MPVIPDTRLPGPQHRAQLNGERGVTCSPDQHRSPPVADQLFPSDWPRSSSNNKLIKTFHFNTIKTNQHIQHHQQHSYSCPNNLEAMNHVNRRYCLWARNVKQDHLRMNVAPDQKIILGPKIFLDHKSLSSIDQKSWWHSTPHPPRHLPSHPIPFSIWVGHWRLFGCLLSPIHHHLLSYYLSVFLPQYQCCI